MFFKFGKLGGMEVEVYFGSLKDLITDIVICSRETERLAEFELESKILSIDKIELEDIYYVVLLHDSDENETKLVAICESYADAEKIWEKQKDWILMKYGKCKQKKSVK